MRDIRQKVGGQGGTFRKLKCTVLGCTELHARTETQTKQIKYPQVFKMVRNVDESLHVLSELPALTRYVLSVTGNREYHLQTNITR